ncbi:unnamed protein product [Phytophthora fragariaefolia]|uniref:Unnamed protein product n=1 Tax=Phytophthora fragariaefolia TaxID=1490495 RepID=A0A9W6U7V1_9STRA|nr:unnamed protein product [Phytophthora fragariaefolia]
MVVNFAAALFASALLAADFQASRATATNYAGGWSRANPTSECVDICSAPAKTCLTSAVDCLAKTETPGDFDYLVLEQLFMPQFCRDLLKGYDETISHQNVDVYPNGTTCVASRVKSELTIHGLWPNYNDGYVSCCNPNSTVTNQPYNAAEFALLESDLLATMGEKWIDATQESTYDTLCEIYEHEFQKHGLCYHADGDDFISAAVTYFTATLNTAEHLSTATEQINKWAAQPTPQTTLAEIEALYDHGVIVLCSSVDGNNSLSSIRTCSKTLRTSRARARPRRPTVRLSRRLRRSSTAQREDHLIRRALMSSELELQFQARIAQAKEAARLASIAAAARAQGAPNGPPFAASPAVPGVPFRPPPIHANAPPVSSRFAAAPEPPAMGNVPTEARNRIDRLVEFVARNGDAFEATARERERDNPDFAFLMPGGLFSDYYQWKKQRVCSVQPPHVGASTGHTPSTPPRAPFGSPNAQQASPLPADPLGSMAVGAMANVCKFARVSGVAAYAPIPREVIANVRSLPPVEPARLEIRLSEFYRDEERTRR